MKIDLEPPDQSWGVRDMYVKDADGNCLRFMSKAAVPGEVGNFAVGR